MAKTLPAEPVSLIKDIDFCVLTQGNRENLERAIHAIAKHFPGAKVFVGDTSLDFDRTYYKQLRTELEAAGLVNRMVIYQLAHKAGSAAARNYMMSNTPNKYKLFLEDTDVVDGGTDIQRMAAILETHKTIGVVGGVLVENGIKDTPHPDGDTFKTDGVDIAKTKQVNRFVLVARDLQNYIRFDSNARDYMSKFCEGMPRVPYQMMVLKSSILNSVITKDEEKDPAQTDPNAAATKEPAGDSTGNTPEPNVPAPGESNGGDGKGAPVGKDEAIKNPTNSR